MLTLILIVVLSGVAGLLALALLDDDEAPTTDGAADPESLRASTPDASSPKIVLAAPTRPGSLTLVPPHLGPPYGDPEGVPSGARAVEGTFAEIAGVPWWRRLVSLAAILVIVVVLGAAVAAVLGGMIGAASELLDGAIE